MKWGAVEPEKHDLSSLRLLGSVGEPINPEAWMWYWQHIGGGRCPVVDTWWQTETGGIMISPLPGATTLKPGSATFPLPGIGAEVVDDVGKRVDRGGGYLTLTRPWPSMLRGIYGDPERYKKTYWSRFEGRYFAGDGAKIDDEGYFWLLGRVDDVMNVSGHRISTTEVESSLVSHPTVAEAAVVGAKDDVTGQAIIAFVTLRGGEEASIAHGEELRRHVAQHIGAIARPKTVIFTPDLPKTRSGKIMRRLLQDVAEGRDLGDTTTLADATVVDEIRTAPRRRRKRTESVSGGSVPEVRELEGDAEVAFAQLRDDVLQVVALLAADAQLVTLGLALDTLEPEILDELVELARLVGGDPRIELGRLAHRASGCLLELAVLERLQRDPTLHELLLEHLAHRTEAVLGGGAHRELEVVGLDGRARPLEVVPGGQLSLSLVERVAHLLLVDLGDDVEGRHGRQSSFR